MEFLFLTLLLLIVCGSLIYILIAKKKRAKLESQVRNKIAEDILIAFGIANNKPNIDFDTKLPSDISVQVLGHLSENSDLELITYRGTPAVLVNSALFLIKISINQTLIIRRVDDHAD